MTQQKPPVYFEFFTEVGIINQLARAMLEARLPSDMTVHHFSVANHLARHARPQTPLMLANAFQVPKTSMSHTLAGLEQRGLIRFESNPEDGRSKCAYLTDKGHEFLGQTIASMGPDVGKLYQTLPVDLIKKVLPALTEIRQILDNMRG